MSSRQAFALTQHSLAFLYLRKCVTVCNGFMRLKVTDIGKLDCVPFPVLSMLLSIEKESHSVCKMCAWLSRQERNNLGRISIDRLFFSCWHFQLDLTIVGSLETEEGIYVWGHS